MVSRAIWVPIHVRDASNGSPLILVSSNSQLAPSRGSGRRPVGAVRFRSNGNPGDRRSSCTRRRAAAFVGVASSALLAEELASARGAVAISALAEGADTLFAEAAVTAHVPLEIVRPFSCYADDFRTEPSRQRYRALAAEARKETRLRYKTRSVRAYEAAMCWVVDHCDILVAAWDGRPARGPGGTAHAVRHAELIGRPVVRLDVTYHVVRRLAAA